MQREDNKPFAPPAFQFHPISYKTRQETPAQASERFRRVASTRNFAPAQRLHSRLLPFRSLALLTKVGFDLSHLLNLL